MASSPWHNVCLSARCRAIESHDCQWTMSAHIWIDMPYRVAEFSMKTLSLSMVLKRDFLKTDLTDKLNFLEIIKQLEFVSVEISVWWTIAQWFVYFIFYSWQSSQQRQDNGFCAVVIKLTSASSKQNWLSVNINYWTWKKNVTRKKIKFCAWIYFLCASMGKSLRARECKSDRKQIG